MNRLNLVSLWLLVGSMACCTSEQSERATTLVLEVRSPASIIDVGTEDIAYPRLVLGHDGGFYLAWTEASRGADAAIHLQAYRPDGELDGPPVLATVPGESQLLDWAACASGRGKVLAAWTKWYRYEPPGADPRTCHGTLCEQLIAGGPRTVTDGANVQAASLKLGDLSVSAPVVVNSFTDGSQFAPSMACGRGLTGVAMWSSACDVQRRDESGTTAYSTSSACEQAHSSGIYARRISADGSDWGPEFFVADWPQGLEELSASLTLDGGFVVAASLGQDENARIAVRKFNGLNTLDVQTEIPADSALRPDVACWRRGECVVAWMADDVVKMTALRDGRLEPIAEFPVFEAHASMDTWSPGARLACDEHGLCAIAWTVHERIMPSSDVLTPRPLGVFARLVDATRMEVGPETQLTRVAAEGALPAIAAIARKTFVAAWQEAAVPKALKVAHLSAREER